MNTLQENLQNAFEVAQSLGRASVVYIDPDDCYNVIFEMTDIANTFRTGSYSISPGRDPLNGKYGRLWEIEVNEDTVQVLIVERDDAVSESFYNGGRAL